MTQVLTIARKIFLLLDEELEPWIEYIQQKVRFKEWNYFQNSGSGSTPNALSFSLLYPARGQIYLDWDKKGMVNIHI